MIDAEKYHDTTKAKELIAQALTSCAGSKPELARRMGMTRQYINAVLRGDKAMSYGMQVMLEQIAKEKPRD
ncbi:helix-turn-helix domain-containing protein [Vreelandella venusta]|uniref:helix-turn-helix domain-containing protein n=1 Tax=Vreelandella venusta TaxID=44935 RepID=UPI003F661050